ncbi:hypothetical protein E1B28_012939 [Marasmius oreades]|uniref:N-acetyltransferase domain-containing protein n=1 Tax=Marasmius oreades TaxID=181124 RepID=A0A9P7RTY6_9AGAR|nr:uncharacterized protein E1B28_012939 [Marasmius oreades]KAG7088993.1 hypothetical protein E1B28_012939 [Marasmius oreades]
MGPDITISQIAPAQTIHLRHTVLWPNLDISYVQLPEDEQGFHFGAFVDTEGSPNGQPVAVISLFLEPLPVSHPNLEESNPNSPLAGRFRKFACSPSYQNRGIGTRLLQYTSDYAISKLNARVVWCDARLDGAGWYERRGMKRFGENFRKQSIEYVRMKVEY